jgi:prophage regulatory protein
MPSNTLSKRERERREAQRQQSFSKNATKRFLRLPEVMLRVGLRHTQIYAMMAEGRFPRPVKVGARAVAWLESEIDAYQDACIAERDAAE